jgi:hypothetical protein
MMDQAVVEKLRERLNEACKSTQALAQAAQDFPALTCNVNRVKASLKMVAIDLGLTTVDSQGDF